MPTPLTGAESQTTVNYLQELKPEAQATTQYKLHGYHTEGETVIAWDNTSGILRKDQFTTEAKALHWLYEN